MQFAEAIAKLEEKFGPMADPLGFAPDQEAHIGSAGVLEHTIDEKPALCLNRDTAIRLWFETVMAELRDKMGPMIGPNDQPSPTLALYRWRITDGPHCDKWRITIQDERCTHRIAADRYSVICTIGLCGTVAPSDAPEAQPDKD